MLVKKIISQTLLIGIVAVGVVKADIVQTLHSTTAWQSLGIETVGSNMWSGDNAKTTTNNGVSWMDASGDGIITVGETVTFSVDIYKEYMGTHDFDALKVWINEKEVYRNTWDLTGSGDYLVGAHNTFSFSTSFDAVGDYDLVARVTCNESLAKLSNDGYLAVTGYNWFTHSDIYSWIPDSNTPTENDWNAWQANSGYTWQGEREEYKFTVVEKNVPEPTLLSLLGCGLLGLAFFRKKNS